MIQIFKLVGSKQLWFLYTPFPSSNLSFAIQLTYFLDPCVDLCSLCLRAGFANDARSFQWHRQTGSVSPTLQKREAAAASSPFFLRIWMRKRLGRRVSSACEISSTFLSCRPNYEVLYLKMVYDSQIVASFPTPLQLIVHASQLFDCTPEVRLL